MSALTRACPAVVAWLVLATELSCSSPAAPSAPPSGKFSEIYPLIFPQTTKGQCSFCHSLPPNEKSNGNLSTGSDRQSAYGALVEKSSTSAKCSGKSYVVPGSPEESLLFIKLTSPTCGEQMPLGGSPLSSDVIEGIRLWIANGAKDD